MPINKIKSYAKINLSLGVIKKVKKLHRIESLIAFIDLHDTIYIKKNNKKSHSVKFYGKFSNRITTNNSIFKLIKLLDKRNLLKGKKYSFIVNKKIPQQSGMGGGSMNAAAILKYFLRKKILILNKKEIEKISYSIGSDVPLFVNQSDCLIREKGNKIINQIFPKYFFLIVKPNINCSTSEMYQQLNSKYFNYMVEYDLDNINEYDVGNDFEEIAIRNNKEIMNILTFLRDLSGAVFSRMTGSGSCCFAVFENLESAIKAQKKFKSSYPKLSCP